MHAPLPVKAVDTSIKNHLNTMGCHADRPNVRKSCQINDHSMMWLYDVYMLYSVLPRIIWVVAKFLVNVAYRMVVCQRLHNPTQKKVLKLHVIVLPNFTATLSMQIRNKLSASLGIATYQLLCARQLTWYTEDRDMIYILQQ